MENSQPQTGNKPVAKFRFGRVNASLWANETEGNGIRYSASFERRYRDRKTGEWRTAQSYDEQDLASLTFLLQQVKLEIFELQLDRKAA